MAWKRELSFGHDSRVIEGVRVILLVEFEAEFRASNAEYPVGIWRCGRESSGTRQQARRNRFPLVFTFTNKGGIGVILVIVQ